MGIATGLRKKKLKRNHTEKQNVKSPVQDFHKILKKKPQKKKEKKSSAAFQCTSSI